MDSLYNRYVTTVKEYFLTETDTSYAATAKPIMLKNKEQELQNEGLKNNHI